MADPEWVRLDPGADVRRQLTEACRDRRVVVCADGAGRLRVEAGDIRAVALSLASAGEPFGLRLAGAAVAGRLDLSAADVPAPLHLLSCAFAEAPVFEGARLHELTIATAVPGAAMPRPRPSELPGLLANGLSTRRDVVLSGSTVRGAHRTPSSLTRSSAVWLTEARIGGRLLAVGTVIEATGDRAMQCDRTSVAGDVRLVQGFRATGEVRLLAMRLGGSLDLTAASLLPGNFRALDLAEATVGGSVFILDDPDLRLRPRIHGRVELGRTVVNGRILIRNADLRSPPPGSGLHDYNPAEADERTVLLAPRLTVHGDVTVEPDTAIHGALTLAGADLAGGLQLSGVQLWNPGGRALDLSRATLGAGLRLTDALVEGTVSVANARIGGPVELTGARLREPAGHRCVDGVGVTVDGDLQMAGVATRGGSVRLRGARIGGVVAAEGADLRHSGGKTLDLDQAIVAGNVRLCQGFASEGVVVLNRAVVEGRLRCDDATLSWTGPPAPDNPRGAAFEAISATFRGGLGLGWRIGAGGVDLSGVQAAFLADRPGDWPRDTYLDGFTYQRFAAPDNGTGAGTWDAEARIGWLAGLTPFDPGSWEQAARVVRANGDQRGADRIVIARDRHARRRGPRFSRRPLAYVVDVLKEWLVGYGHRPSRALVALIALVAVIGGALSLPAVSEQMRTGAGGVVYSPTRAVSGPAPLAGPCGGGSVRCFEAWSYAVDTVVPVIDLKQRSTWHPGGQWLARMLNLCTILGWIASTFFVLSFARLGRSAAG
ncbi:hypothetical protein ABZS66_24730 [Dactylosporangium sp. NPDC005572]|uniref:hypothetical protein n=1 Tax=Dactylosporangium sp. NPDC005572 TaxID=3156889 RepID=UPI0033B974E5